MQKPEDNNGDTVNEDLPELASLSNRFSYFENFDEKQENRKKKSDAAPGEEGGEREMVRTYHSTLSRIFKRLKNFQRTFVG